MKKKPKRARNSLDEMRINNLNVGTETNHRTVFDQETKTSEMFGGGRRARKGGAGKAPFDGISELFVIENKQTTKDSITLKKEWLKTVSDAAVGRSRIPLLAVEFRDLPVGYDKEWAILPLRKLKDLIDDRD